jgi:hypothetical protein
MFDELRDSLRALSSRLDPDERRRMGSGMREAMVHAKLAVNDMRAALAVTEQRLGSEQTELDTVRRRQGLAADIGDNETVEIAERFATQHAERVAVLEALVEKLQATNRQLMLEAEAQAREAEARVAEQAASALMQHQRVAALEAETVAATLARAEALQLPPPPSCATGTSLGVASDSAGSS